MENPRICVAITGKNIEAIKAVEPLTDLFEVRIDLIGEGWQELTKQLAKPWIACNRRAEEGGHWTGSEDQRIKLLLQSLEPGAAIVDIELRTKHLEKVVPVIKEKAQCLLSFHDLERTPPLDELKKLVKQQLAAGADICKVVTTARHFGDNLTVLKLISEFPEARLVSFAMGDTGLLSRALSPLAGADFTYTSIETGKESAPGQITVKDLRAIYQTIMARVVSEVSQ